MEVKHFYDPATFTLSYVVFDRKSLDAVIIDPVLDYDPASATITTQSVMRLMNFIGEENLRVHYILETHVHADHISAAHELLEKHLPNAKIGVGRGIRLVQETFKLVYNFPESFKSDGSQFHHLFSHGEEILAGSLKFKTLFTPGHTPACVSYLFGNMVFTGDALLLPDSGTGRCDFPNGNAAELYRSIRKVLYELPDATVVYVGHDYQPGGRNVEYTTTISEEKEKNIHLNLKTSEEEFVSFRKARDATLSAPKLLFPSIQVNMAAGQFLEAEANGRKFLKIPVTFL